MARRRAGPDPHPNDTRWTIPFHISEGFSEDLANSRAQNFIRSLLARNRVPALSGHGYGLSNIAYVQEEVDSQGVHPPPNPNKVAIHGSCSPHKTQICRTLSADQLCFVAFWMVTADASVRMIEGEDIDGYDYEDIEVASRVL